MSGPHISALAVVALAVSGCSDQGPDLGPQAELRRNESLWSTTRPASYVYTVERQCFCLGSSRGPVRVSVVGASVAARVYTATGEPVPEELAELFPSVDGLFDVIRDALQRDAHELRVTYEPGSGVPLEIWIDYVATVIDEELGFMVVEIVQPAPSS